MERARFHLVRALLHFPSNETQLILPREEDRGEQEKREGEVRENVGGRGEEGSKELLEEKIP